MIRTSQRYTGENPRITSRYMPSKKNDAKSMTTTLQHTSRHLDIIPERFMECFKACNEAIEGIIAGHAIETH